MAPKAQQGENLSIYTWKGIDKHGKRLKGETSASNQAMLRADLRRQGINPLKIKQKAAPLFASKKKITPTDICLFSRQLATMMLAGIPMVQAFEVIGRGNENPSMEELILSLKVDIEEGIPLATALAKHPYYFDDLFCSLVQIGEAAGALENLLDKIATYKEKTEAMKGKIKKALFYPVAVTVVAVLVSALLMIFVIPQFQSLFASFGADLPAFTQLVVAISEWVQAWWWAALLGCFAAAYLLGGLWKRSREFRQKVDIVMLKMPILGIIINKAAIARFARTTATMLAAGVPMVEALESVAGATGNIVYGNAVLRIREDIATGQSLQLSMQQQNIFPHMVVKMLAIGEESGAIDTMLSKVADFYEDEVDNLVDGLSSLLEPLIMVVLGSLVGGLIVAMYLPIFKMASVM